MLGHGRHDVQHEAIGLRHVGRDELHPAFHQPRNEGNRPRQAIQLGDHQAGLVLAAQGERSGELGPVILAPALYLHELTQEPSSLNVGSDSGPLCFKAEAALPLPIGGHAKVGEDRSGLFQGML